MLSHEQILEVADALREAEHAVEPISPLTVTWPEIDLADAYQIQLTNIGRRLDAGATIQGHKVGLTARAMQRMLNVNEPDYGHLMDDMFIQDGGSLDSQRYCAARIELEIAFVLKDSLLGGNCSPADAIAATDYCSPAFELIDSRIADWKIKLIDTVADNASAAGVILGAAKIAPQNLDLRLGGALLFKNGEIVETGAAGAVLGNPAVAVAWLANKLAEFDQTLEAGSVVLPGSCTAAIRLEQGDLVEAEIAGLGKVSVHVA